MLQAGPLRARGAGWGRAVWEEARGSPSCGPHALRGPGPWRGWGDAFPAALGLALSRLSVKGPGARPWGPRPPGAGWELARRPAWPLLRWVPARLCTQAGGSSINNTALLEPAAAASTQQTGAASGRGPVCPRPRPPQAWQSGQAPWKRRPQEAEDSLVGCDAHTRPQDWAASQVGFRTCHPPPRPTPPCLWTRGASRVCGCAVSGPWRQCAVCTRARAGAAGSRVSTCSLWGFGLGAPEWAEALARLSAPWPAMSGSRRRRGSLGARAGQGEPCSLAPGRRPSRVSTWPWKPLRWPASDSLPCGAWGAGGGGAG